MNNIPDTKKYLTYYTENNIFRGKITYAEVYYGITTYTYEHMSQFQAR